MDIEATRKRLSELNTKAYYLLVALTFLYRPSPSPSLKIAITLTALVAALPVQDYFRHSATWLKSMRILKITCLSLAFLCTVWWVWCTATPTAATAATTLASQQQQKPTPQPAPQATQAQPQQQIDELKKRLDAAELQAKSAALDKDHILRYEAYYEKVLSTQVWTLGIMGFILTAVFGLAAKFSLDIFDRRTQDALEKTKRELRDEYNAALRDEVYKLKESNAQDIKSLNEALTAQTKRTIEDLRIRSKWSFDVSMGLTAAANGSFDISIEKSRDALRTYKAHRDLFTPDSGAANVQNVLVAIQRKHLEDHDLEPIKQELADPIYDNLEEVLPLVALKLPEILEIVRDRKPSTPQPNPNS